MSTRITLLLALLLAIAACGDDGAATTSVPATSTTAATPSATAAPATTVTTTGTVPAATDTLGPADLPDELRAGTYLVGTEIRVGSWEPDECGCIWAIVAADGTETSGTSEDARVGADDHAVRLGPCTWTFSG
jgi:ABC-type Fe3+-hydroxamate transport system substrate-binding protein